MPSQLTRLSETKLHLEHPPEEALLGAVGFPLEGRNNTGQAQALCIHSTGLNGSPKRSASWYAKFTTMEGGGTPGTQPPRGLSVPVNWGGGAAGVETGFEGQIHIDMEA